MRGASDSKNYFSGIILIAKHLLDDFGVILVSTFISEGSVGSENM